MDNLSAGVLVYWSPDYFGETGNVWTVEGNTSYTFRQIGPFTPSISGVLGYVSGQDDDFEAANGFDNYVYWNAGLTLAVDKLSFDFRYWDTSEDYDSGLGCQGSGDRDLCGERFVFSAKVTLP